MHCKPCIGLDIDVTFMIGRFERTYSFDPSPQGRALRQWDLTTQSSWRSAKENSLPGCAKPSSESCKARFRLPLRCATLACWSVGSVIRGRTALRSINLLY